MDTDRRVARYISFIRQTYTLPHLVIVCYPLTNYYALESRLSLEHSVLFRQSWVQQALRNLLHGKLTKMTLVMRGRGGNFEHGGKQSKSG